MSRRWLRKLILGIVVGSSGYHRFYGYAPQDGLTPTTTSQELGPALTRPGFFVPSQMVNVVVVAPLK